MNTSIYPTLSAKESSSLTRVTSLVTRGAVRGHMRVLFLGIALMLSLSACGKHDSVDQSKYPVQVYPSGDASGGKILFDAATASCKSNDQCPTSVGLLTFWVSGEHASSAGMCTSFLIAKDLALTNSHCIPDEMRNKSQRPTEQMKIVFPAVGSLPETSVGVDNIISFTDLTGAIGKNPDYAVLKLQQEMNDRDILKMSHDGLPDDFSFRIFSITPTSDHAVIGELEIKECKTMMDSGVQPSYLNKFSPVVSFTECGIRHGNSGSPMIDSKGMVRGIIQAGVDQDSLELIAKKLEIDTLKPLNLGTNSACMKIDGISKPVDSACNEKTPQLDLGDGIKQLKQNADKDERFIKSLTESLRQKIDTWENTSLKPPVEWVPAVLGGGDELFTFPIPECFTRPPPRISYALLVPRWKLIMSLDSSLRLTATVNPSVDDTQANVSFGFTSLQYHFSGSASQSRPGIGYCKH